MKKPAAAAAALLLVFWATGPMPAQESPPVGPVVINELLAANSENRADAQGQYDDWIELHNLGDQPVNVAGMYLTDDIQVPLRWRIPDDDPALTTIPPQGYLLVWADNDVGDPGLHANFLLDADGEELALFADDGTTALDHVEFPAQMADVSYGRVPNGTGGFWHLSFPTPAGPNFRVFEGFVARPEFSRDHGFYDSEISVTITCDLPDAIIYYTTDGSEPYIRDSMRKSDSAAAYTEPLLISTTTCLRATATKFQWEPSPTETQTYIFIDDVIRQSPGGQAPGAGWPSSSVNGQTIDYGMDPGIVDHPSYAGQMADALLAIPSFSLVTDLGNLFDSRNGIYVNARSQGRSWERPVSVELIYPDEREGFQIDAGLRIRGGYSRSGGNPKHAFRLFFRPEYGTARLKYPLFGDEGVDEFENVDLRTSQNYSWSFDGSSQNTFLRDVFSRDTQRDMGQPYTRSRYYHLYLNGQYWGLFQTQERSEASFAASYFGGAKEQYDIVKVEPYYVTTTDGNLDAYRRLWEEATAGFDDDARYYRVQGLDPNGVADRQYEKLLDIDNLIDYMLCTFYVGDFDGPLSNFLGNNRPNNFYGIYNRENPDGFKWFRHDAEHSLIDRNGWGLDRTGPYTHPDLAQFRYFIPQWLQQELLDHPEFRMRLADRAHRHFFNDGVLTYESSKARMLARAQRIETAIIAESARWGDAKRSSPYTKEHWEREVDRIINDYGDFGLPNRTQVVLNQLRSKAWYPSVAAPSFNRHGGQVDAGFELEMSASSDIYYTLDGSDPRLPEKAGRTSGTHVLVAESAAKRVLVPTGSIDDAWRGGAEFDDSDWALVTGAPGGVGYERSSGYEAWISHDVGSEMYGGATSCYVRVPFTVAGDVNGIDFMVLKMRYDDGFVAYLNGTEVQRALFTGEPQWDSLADGNHEASVAESFYISEHIGLLRPGQNILAIHALNVSTSSSDFIVAPSLETGQTTAPEGGGISPTAIRYEGPVPLDTSTLVKARARSGGVWSALNEAVFAVGPVAESLRISEIMYHPTESGDPNDPNTEFVELTNIGAEMINLNLVKFTNGIDFAFAGFELTPGDFCLVVKDIAAFEARYGLGFNIAGQYTGSLNNAGERIELQDAAGQVIHSFRFADGWYDITDGLGFSLTVKDPATADPNGLGDKSVWRPSAFAGGSPGFDDSDAVPALGSIVINELLANSVGGVPDWIELHNTTGRAIDIGGWFLSDDRGELTKYEIAPGTTIPAGGYVIFDQDRHFGNEDDPGCHDPFALSRDGETVYLHSGADGALGGYSEQEKFDPSEPGVSLGRYQKSTGAFNFVALSEPTPGMANAYPLVGPVVINEIMYHPDAPADAEYVELLNISDTAVTLYDTDRDTPWRFTDDPDDPGIELLLPGDPPVTLAPGEYLVLAKDLNVFTSRFGAPEGVQVLAWGAGNLANGSEKVQLSKPGDQDPDGTRLWFRVDRVVYSDGAHHDDFLAGVDPWPAEPDGQGMSLSRIEARAYGNDPANWQAADPSPGR